MVYYLLFSVLIFSEEVQNFVQCLETRFPRILPYPCLYDPEDFIPLGKALSHIKYYPKLAKIGKRLLVINLKIYSVLKVKKIQINTRNDILCHCSPVYFNVCMVHTFL